MDLSTAICMPFTSSNGKLASKCIMSLQTASAAPVSMRTVMPARLHCCMAGMTSGRRGSCMPTSAISVRSCSS